MDQGSYQKFLKQYGKGYSSLEKALKTIPKKAWSFKPVAEEWSIAEVIVHLADSEANSMSRARLLYAESGRTLMAYDQALWAGKLDYSGTDLDTALLLLKGVRKFTHQWLKTVAYSDFVNSAIHPEYEEPYTFEKWIGIYSNHIFAHIEQINNNHILWKAQRKQKTKKK